MPEPDHSVAHVNRYAEDVVAGKQIAGKLVIQACERHLRDLETGHERGLFFDEVEVSMWFDFIGLQNHSKGEWAGQPFQLERWQQFIIGNVVGWKWKETGFRRFKTAYVEVARKNGKTTLLAALGLGGMLIDDEPGAEIYSVATKRDQAMIVYEEAESMVRRSPWREEVKWVNKTISDVSSRSFFRALGADHNTLDGLNVHFGLVDELHAHRDPRLYEVIETATGARRQPLIFAITTAGSDQTSFCWEQHEYSEKILGAVLEGLGAADAELAEAAADEYTRVREGSYRMAEGARAAVERKRGLFGADARNDGAEPFPGHHRQQYCQCDDWRFQTDRHQFRDSSE